MDCYEGSMSRIIDPSELCPNDLIEVFLTGPPMKAIEVLVFLLDYGLRIELCIPLIP